MNYIIHWDLYSENQKHIIYIIPLYYNKVINYLIVNIIDWNRCKLHLYKHREDQYKDDLESIIHMFRQLYLNSNRKELLRHLS